MINFKRIILIMLNFYKRLWQVFFVAVPVWLGVATAFLAVHCPLGFIIMVVVASICLVVALIGLWLDYFDARAKRNMELNSLYNELKEKHPDWTEEQVQKVTKNYYKYYR